MAGEDQTTLSPTVSLFAERLHWRYRIWYFRLIQCEYAEIVWEPGLKQVTMVSDSVAQSHSLLFGCIIKNRNMTPRWQPLIEKLSLPTDITLK